MWLPRLLLVIGVVSTCSFHVESTTGASFAVEKNIPKVAWAPWVSRRSSPWAPPLPKSAFAGSFTSILLSKVHSRLPRASELALCGLIELVPSFPADQDLVYLESTIHGFLEVGGTPSRSAST